MSERILPKMDLPVTTSTHGAERTPRCARLWDYLNRMRVPLSDFSTDECVSRALPALREARDNLAGAIARMDFPEAKDEASAARFLHAFEETVRDIDTLITRTPQARIKAKRGTR